MKKPVLFIVALSAVICACNKEQPLTLTSTPVPAEMTITAGTDSNLKTSLNGTAVLWQQDTLVVFDEALAGVKFSTTAKDVATAEFTTNSWTGKVPEYAASYYPEWNTAYEMTAASKGMLPVEIRPTQTIGWAGTFGKQSYASVGKITENNGTFSISEMKNVMGLIGVKFTDAGITKIVATAIGGEQMTGWVTVDYEKLANGEADFWTAIEGKTNSKSATINVSKAGQYYISVLPQIYSQGIKFQVYKGDDLFVERTIGATSGVTITRNKITPLAKDIDDLLPSTVVLDIRFHNADNVCPFGTLATKANQTTNGEAYSFAYNYEYNSNDYTKNFTFKLGNSGTITNGYAYAVSTIAYMKGAKNFVFNDANGWVLAPAIEGKYLQTVTVGMSNGVYSKDRYMRIKKVLSESLAQKQPAASTETGPVATSIHFYADGNDGVTSSMAGNITEKNTQYYIQFSTSIQIDYLTLTYTDTLPSRN